MADGIQVVCPHCGRNFTVSEDLAGQSTTCPKCERQVAVAIPVEQQTQRPRLQVRRGTPIAGDKACPGCGAVMAEDAVICVHCGFDTRTGMSWQTKPAKKNILKPILAVVGIVIAAGWLHLWLKARRESGPIGDQPPVAQPSMPTVLPSAQDEKVVSPITSASTQAEVSGIESVSDAVSSEVATNAAEIAAAPRMSKEELERQLTETLNARYPMYTRGAQAVLRQNNGLVHRGEILVLGTNSVTLKTELGIREIAFSALDKESRLRCDPEVRRRLVNLRVEQLMSTASSR